MQLASEGQGSQEALQLLRVAIPHDFGGMVMSIGRQLLHLSRLPAMAGSSAGRRSLQELDHEADAIELAFDTLWRTRHQDWTLQTALNEFDKQIVPKFLRMAEVAGQAARDQPDRALRLGFEAVSKEAKRASVYSGSLRDLMVDATLQRHGATQEEVNLNRLMTEVREELAQEFEIEPGFCDWIDPLPTLRIARGHAHSLLTNLVKNAVKYRSEARQLRVRLVFLRGGSYAKHLTEFSELRPVPLGRMHLHVIDAGKGIAQEHRADIFKPFWRVSSRPMPLAELPDELPELGPSIASGTFANLGVGLSVCRLICRRYRSHLTVWSKVDRGTDFRIDFPRDLEREAS